MEFSFMLFVALYSTCAFGGSPHGEDRLAHEDDSTTLLQAAFGKKRNMALDLKMDSKKDTELFEEADRDIKGWSLVFQCQEDSESDRWVVPESTALAWASKATRVKICSDDMSKCITSKDRTYPIESFRRSLPVTHFYGDGSGCTWVCAAHIWKADDWQYYINMRADNCQADQAYLANSCYSSSGPHISKDPHGSCNIAESRGAKLYIDYVPLAEGDLKGWSLVFQCQKGSESDRWVVPESTALSLAGNATRVKICSYDMDVCVTSKRNTFPIISFRNSFPVTVNSERPQFGCSPSCAKNWTGDTSLVDMTVWNDIDVTYLADASAPTGPHIDKKPTGICTVGKDEDSGAKVFIDYVPP